MVTEQKKSELTFLNERFVRHLSGKSGCHVSLMIDEKGNKFVRKVSSCPSYNTRLIKQAQSLSDLPAVYGVRFPSVINIAEHNGLSYYDMEYIVGQPFYQYTSRVSIKKSLDRMATILDWIEYCAEGSVLTENTLSDVVASKVQSVFDVVQIDNEFNSFVLEWVDQAFKRCSEMPTGSYHGDMSFENIIIDENDNVCFIDTLDSYLGCYLADASKLMNDLMGHWSELNTGFAINPGVYHSLVALACNRMPMMVYDGVAQRLFVVDLLRTLPYTAGQQRLMIAKRVLEVINGHDDRTRSRIVEQISRRASEVDANKSRR